MSVTLYFDSFAFDDPNGTSLGELTRAYDKEFRAVDNSMGSGQFTINRHDDEYADHLARVGNLIRVRRVSGGPFDYDDSRYVGAFWIEEGQDELVSPDEQGGDTITRGGRSAEACLRWAILYPDAFYENNEKFTTKTRKNGNWVIDERTAGEVLAIFLRDCEARTPSPLPFVDRDFGVLQDSTNEDWSDSDTKWRIPVGTDGLSLLGTLVSGDLFYRMGADMVMHAYEEHPGVDLSGSITIAHAVDLSEAATRDIHGRNAVSRVVVRGTQEDGDIKYREVVSTSVEDTLGRREGYVEYKRTPTNNKLNKAGNKYIRKMKKRHDGPTTVGVIESSGQEAFDDFVPGDYLNLYIPGEFADVTVQVAAIVLTEREGGDTDVVLEFEDQPFDPAHNEAEFGDGSDGGGGGKDCGDCPPLPPHTDPPGEECEDYYPPCVDAWPYEGVVSGLSDGHNFGCDAVAHQLCFESNTEYAFEISGVSADPGAYAWAFNIGRECNGVQTFGVCSEPAPDGASWTHSGTFTTDGTIDPLHDYVAWGSHADSTHFSGGRAFTINFRVWPVEGSGENCVPANVPLDGQQHTEQFTGDAAEDTFQTAYPYAPGSLHVTVNGVAVTVTETDPTTGEFTFVTPPPSGAVILASYQNAGTTPTGGPGTQPTPTPTPTAADIHWREPVRVATTAAITISTGLNSGDTIDGVTLATGDRVLVKDQAAGAENGIYVVAASPARAADFDSGAEVLGSAVLVTAGTVNASRVYLVTNATAPTIGSTTITFAQLSGSSIAELDDIPDVNAPSPSDGQVLTWDSTPGEWIAATPAAGGGGGVGIGAKAYNSSTQSLAASTTDIVTLYDSEEFDTDGFHDTGSNTGRMTIPAGLGGKYLLTAGGLHVNGSASTLFYFRKGGSTQLRAGLNIGPTNSVNYRQNISTVVDLVAGDYVELLITTNAGASQTWGHASNANAQAFFSIMRLDSGTQSDIRGFAPIAMQAGASPVADAYTNASNLAAAGGVAVFPIVVPATMTVHSARIRSTDTGTARSWEWRLFTDAGSTTLAEVAGLSGSESFTPSAASTRDANATTATQISPGTYWLAIRNTHATNTLGLGYATNQTSASVLGTGPAVILNSITGALGSTLDVSSITIFARMYGVALTGRVWGQSVGLFE